MGLLRSEPGIGGSLPSLEFPYDNEAHGAVVLYHPSDGRNHHITICTFRGIMAAARAATCLRCVMARAGFRIQKKVPTQCETHHQYLLAHRS